MSGGSDVFPPGYVRFNEFRSLVPEPTRIQVSDDVALETLHLPGEETSLVFIHGGLGSLWNPYPQLQTFASERDLVTYSLAGNGNSTTRPSQSIDGHVADLRALLEELDIVRPIIHGHSYGTAIAIEYAKKHPTSALVLHAGGDHDLTPAWEKPLLRLFLSLRLYKLPSNKALMRQLAHSVGAHEETAKVVIEDFLQSNPMPHRRSAWETVTEGFWGYDGREDMSLVNCPALVIQGPADGIVPLEVARNTADRIPEGVFYRLERAGHIGMIERPAIYNSLLRAVGTTVKTGQSLEESVRRVRDAEMSSE